MTTTEQYIVMGQLGDGQPGYWRNGTWYADIKKAYIYKQRTAAYDVVRNYGGEIVRIEPPYPSKVTYATIEVTVLGHDIPVEVGYTGNKTEDELYEMAREQLRRLI